MNVHSSPLSAIDFDSAHQMLTMVWNRDSGKLDEQTVKSEIGGIINYIREYQVRHVIVDSRNYRYRDNPSIQTWITRQFMPRVVDSSVIKYAIIVKPSLFKQLKGPEAQDEGILPIVDYFTELADAQQWIKS